MSIAQANFANPSPGLALLEMVPVPPGRFWKGANDEDDRFASILEKPRHLIEIGEAFQISKYPVTFEQWDAFSNDIPLAHHPSDNGHGRGRNPVFNVSFDDAIAFADWLSRQTSEMYRLPTETEWEYCCRAGTDSVFETGGDISVSQANFLYTDFAAKPGVGHPVPVGSYPPNAFGICDMHGNVSEWVADPWRDTYCSAPADDTWRVVRGGGWDAMPRILRCAFRDAVRRDRRMDNLGFRLACGGAR
jgi:formylglycine-generating enzyme required for sulfatase activity